MAAKKNDDLNLNSIKAILDAEEKVHLHLFKDSEKYNDDLVFKREFVVSPGKNPKDC